MITTFLIGLLASSVLATGQPVVDTDQYSFSVLDKNYSEHVVQEGEYISRLAERFYGSEDYWTNIWNDNPELESANQVAVGTSLKIRKSKSVLPEVLSASLSARLNSAYMYSQASGVEVKKVSQPVISDVVQSSTIVQSESPKSLTMEQITYLGQCEAGMDPAKNTGNGYYGAFQFSIPTWNSMGTGYARADLAPLDVQIDAVQRLLSRSSIYTQFPGCARKMRSIGLI